MLGFAAGQIVSLHFRTKTIEPCTTHPNKSPLIIVRGPGTIIIHPPSKRAKGLFHATCSPPHTLSLKYTNIYQAGTYTGLALRPPLCLSIASNPSKLNAFRRRDTQQPSCALSLPLWLGPCERGAAYIHGLCVWHATRHTALFLIDAEAGAAGLLSARSLPFIHHACAPHAPHDTRRHHNHPTKTPKHHTQHTGTQSKMRCLSSSSPSSFPVLRVLLLAACFLSVAAAAPFLLRGDASSTATVMEREKQWFGGGNDGQQQQQQEWPQNVPQYRGRYRE